MSRRWRFGAAIGLVVALAAAGCAPSDGALGRPGLRHGAADRLGAVNDREHRTGAATTTLDLSVLPSCWPDPWFGQPPTAPVPGDLAATLDAFAADARVAPNAASVSVWIDGLGEVLTHDPDVALAPASNQKLLPRWARWRSSGPIRAWRPR